MAYKGKTYSKKGNSTVEATKNPKPWNYLRTVDLPAILEHPQDQIFLQSVQRSLQRLNIRCG